MPLADTLKAGVTFLKQRMAYNCETNTRFFCLLNDLKTAQSLEKRDEPEEAEYQLAKLEHDVATLRVHLRAWREHHPEKKRTR